MMNNRHNPELIALGLAELDQDLHGGFAHSCLHEIYAGQWQDVPAATGFTIALARRMAGNKPLLWIRQSFLDTETGKIHPSGLAEFGIDPGRIIMVRVKDFYSLLKAGADAARCGALGCIIIEPWGEQNGVDLTASRRLALAAEQSGTTILVLRLARTPNANAARTRWRINALPSSPLPANAPGNPALCLHLLRHRQGITLQDYHVEWNRNARSFQNREFGKSAPLSRPVVSVSANRPPPASGAQDTLARAG